MPALISLIVVAFILYCLLDVVLTDPERTRNLRKPLWLFLVLFVPLAGSIAWLLAGRPETPPRRRGGGPGRAAGPGRPPRHHPSSGNARKAPRPSPRGPDDDPEFLRQVDERLRRDEDGGPPDGS